MESDYVAARPSHYTCNKSSSLACLDMAAAVWSSIQTPNRIVMRFLSTFLCYNLANEIVYHEMSPLRVEKNGNMFDVYRTINEAEELSIRVTQSNVDYIYLSVL